jgi:hypothetical protein
MKLSAEKIMATTFRLLQHFTDYLNNLIFWSVAWINSSNANEVVEETIFRTSIQQNMTENQGVSENDFSW